MPPLTQDKYQAVRRLLDENKSVRECVALTGVCKHVVREIKNGRAWAPPKKPPGKLTKEQFGQVKRYLSMKKTHAEIREQTGIGLRTISEIANGREWKPPVGYGKKPQLSVEQTREAKALSQDGVTYAEIGRLFGVSGQAVRRAIRCKAKNFETIHEKILELSRAKRFTQAQIATIVGVSTHVVRRLQRGEVTPRAMPDIVREAEPRYGRCPGCGYRVILPCVACQVESHVARYRKRDIVRTGGETVPDGICLPADKHERYLEVKRWREAMPNPHAQVLPDNHPLHNVAGNDAARSVDHLKSLKITDDRKT